MAAVVTHVIVGVTADNLEATEEGNASSDNGAAIGSPHTDLLTIDSQSGLNWVIISLYVKANSSDTTPKLRAYFYNAAQSAVLDKLNITPDDFWGRGRLIYRTDDAGTAVPTPNGSTEKYVLGPIYVGYYPVRFALEACELGADLIITIERLAIEQLPSY